MLLLTTENHWVSLLDRLLAEQTEPAWLLVASSWQDATQRYPGGLPDLIFSTPSCLPAAEQCPLQPILLLECAPLAPPPGGQDWLARDSLSAEVLRRCVDYSRQRQAWQTQAERDPLTGVINRQGFQALLHKRLQHNRGRGLLLGYLDLDNFKHANDSLGHRAGDQLIQQVAQRLAGVLGPQDCLARLGSDEFALLLDVSQSSARVESVAQTLMQTLAEPYWLQDESLSLGCSLGLAYGRAGEDADRLLWHAQAAMQQAKHEGGCSYRLYDERSSSQARRLADVECELRRALRRDELELHYQPRQDLASGAIVGVEALVRWRHPQRGLLYPQDFIPLAEQSGLIVPLGYWVVDRALRDLRWLAERDLLLNLAINLSFSQFQDSQLLPTVKRLIENCGVAGRWLEFELTETAMMRRSDYVLDTMSCLGELGVRFSLDDFGTGFSSFVHLASLPISLLKLDRSFVSGMAVRPEQSRLVSAMISLARNLGLEVVAEGVESEAELALLQQFGCDQGQGFLISKALPLVELQRFLQGQVQVQGQRQEPLLSLSLG
ncbi:bifunctional diguanylate cyclase/phosphodiesterase [Pseudomonas lalucatii]|uniref:Bifunctional diguanylate cyclase/phosphodiesterase n=1 Tax=Pseudomonas lalucatii TaxID=1424203 RepID=A0ABS5Q157_9PSED|nr:bifunctional diguanylate cyclase/phosphodiesterase [Pseudomonas lalucatii]QVM88865.1 bifunctional diguanylate cyclase/phosphodiesterase [Pseudomonas lalucatii]